ncbi:MAG: hopanoid biosynthesis associated radical SAM protein HpnJ [Nitrospirae bacterium]|nr:hopanoid biosynthesis associated radical SAM protein HpnJ [Nitrospirota bacterium]
MKVLFLNPPSFDDFDGGAGSRYQATREVRSFWYPTWLAYPAGMLPDSRVLDSPASGIDVEGTVHIATGYDLVVLYTSTPSLKNDDAIAARIKAAKPGILTCMVGPHVSVLPDESLEFCPAVDFVVRGELDYPLVEIAKGEPLAGVAGISYRDGGEVVHNPDRPPLHDLDVLPFAAEVYRRDLDYKDYEIPWLQYPYMSIYTGRGCSSKCIYCLWPQTYSGNSYRTRSPQSVLAEVEYIREQFPEVKEIFFDDDNFVEDQERAIEISGLIKPLGISWGCNAKVTAKYETLKAMREAGMRVIMVGYETGDQTILNNVRKGTTIEQARTFTKNCKELGITVHGAFVLGLPGETRQTIEKSIRFACELDPETIQVSLASPYPGTKFYDLCVEKGYVNPASMVSETGYQSCVISYPEVSSAEIFMAVERFYKKFYYRPKYVFKVLRKAFSDMDEMRRIYREAREFYGFIAKRRESIKSC